ncbi:MAG TPA: glycosyltransferase family 2 protein [Gemmataceae bacterium]|nr:glycosyltransferase family 2 protein [Gemmataceae bacterium]
MAFVSIVVPVYHNATSLPELLSRFQQLAGRNPEDRFEFVFVDDGSRDHSFAVLQSLHQTDPRVRVIKLSRNFGSNAALLAGLDQARGEVVAAIAADLQDPPELIDDMLAHWRQGRKVVLAARQSRGDPFLTRLLASTFYMLFRRFAIASMPRQGFDFFLIDRQVCNLIKGIKESNAYLMGMILWLGFDPCILYYHRQQREVRFGKSMWSLTKKLKYFIDAFVAFSYVPVRAASLLGMSLSVLGLLYALALLVLRLFSSIPVVGWVSLMAVLLVVSGVQLLMTGILGEYLWRNLDETRRRPRFVIDRVIENADAADQPAQAA